MVVPRRDPSFQELSSAVVEEPHLRLSEMSNLPEGETFVVDVKKESGAFGLRIAGGKGKPFGGGFIYIKSLVKGTPAEKCNKLKERDIIIKVSLLYQSRLLLS